MGVKLFIKPIDYNRVSIEFEKILRKLFFNLKVGNVSIITVLRLKVKDRKVYMRSKLHCKSKCVKHVVTFYALLTH